MIKIFLETDFAQGMIFESNRTGIINKYTMELYPGFLYIEMFEGGTQWYMMESNGTVSNISCIFKKKSET